MNTHSVACRHARMLTAVVFGLIPLMAQAPAAPPANTAEIASHDQPVTFRSGVNLVLVPVVVRDAQGHAVGNLTRDDFQLFDKGKRQQITKFSVQKYGGQAAAEKPAEKLAGAAGMPEERPEEATAPSAPDHFVAYLFDDVHLKFEDLAYVRDAAGRNIDTLQSNSRVAIITTSGQGTLDFTADRARLHETLLKLRPRPMTGGVRECPDVSYFMADLIENKEEEQPPGASTNPATGAVTITTQTALGVATADTMACMHLPPQAYSEAVEIARSAARTALARGLHESRIALLVLKDAVRRIAMMPGQRLIVLASPGFLAPDELRPDELEVVDRAVRSNVIISSLDARGLWSLNPAGEIDERATDTLITRARFQYHQQEAIAASGVLEEMAVGTGGTFIENTNDFDGAFRRLASAPEFVYVLGYTPERLKSDGSFHAMKVKLNSPGKLTLQARHGYYAPKHSEDPAEAAKQEIQDAVFDRDEIHELPVDLHTQFFKSSESEATLTVVASVSLQQAFLRKDQGRNRNDLTIVSAVFDNDGNFVAGTQKSIEFRLRDETVQKLEAGRPISIRMPFDVHPGKYAIRLVVRDAEGHRLSAENGVVEIP